jgi:hypothetical protein
MKFLYEKVLFLILKGISVPFLIKEENARNIQLIRGWAFHWLY